MRRFALLAVMCVQICVCVSVRAQLGSECTNPIPFGKDYSETISGPSTVWYMGNTFDLPLNVKFYPDNNSDPAPVIKLDLSCTSGVYKDSIACKLFCQDQSSYIPLPYVITPDRKTDVAGNVHYELELGEFYRNQLLRAGISYNLEVYVQVTYFGGGSINVAPDKGAQCLQTIKWLLLGYSYNVGANDQELYFVAPYASWTTDSVRYVWSGTKPATLAISTTCDFDPLDDSDPHRIELVQLNAQDTLNHSNAKILELQKYELNPTNPAPGAMFYVKVLSDEPGVLKMEHIPAAEVTVDAQILEYDQAADVKANDLNALYAIPKSWTSATRFDTPTERIFKMYVGATPDFTIDDAIADFQFNKSEKGHWFGLTEADMTALWTQTSDKFLYVRFNCSENTTVTPSAWNVSDCIGVSTLIEKNTTVNVATRSKEKYRIYFNDWKDGNIAFTWDKTNMCKVLVSGSCDIGTADGEGIIAYEELKDDHLTFQLTAEELNKWASSLDADGYIYMRFYTTASGGGQMTVSSTAPEETDPEDPDPEVPHATVNITCLEGTSDVQISVSKSQTIRIIDTQYTEIWQQKMHPDQPQSLSLPPGQYTLIGEQEQIDLTL